MKTLLNILIVLLIGLLLYILLYPQYQESKVQTVKMGIDGSLASLVIFFAEEKAFLKEQKLIPEYIFLDSPEEIYSQLLDQKIDFAILPWSTVLKRVVATGETVKAFISLNLRTGIPVDAIFTHPNSKITSLKGLKGKKFGLPPGFLDLVQVILIENQTSPKDLILSEIPEKEIVQKLKNGELDCALVLEPYRTQLKKEGMVVLLDGPLPKTFLAPFPGYAYVLNPLLLKEKRKVAVRLKIATDMAISLLDKEPQNARAVLIKRWGLDPELAADFNLPEVEKLAGINKPQIQAYLLNLAERGIINRAGIEELKAENLLCAPIDLQP